MPAHPLSLLLFLGLLLPLTLSSPPSLTPNSRNPPQTLQQSLAGTLLSAQWFLLSGNISTLPLTNPSGNCTLMFSSRSLKQITTSPPYKHTVSKLTILFYDPIYANKGMIHLTLNLQEYFNKEGNLWNGTSEANVTSWDSGNKIEEGVLPVEFVVTKGESIIRLNGVELKIVPVTSRKYDWTPCAILFLEVLAIILLQFTSPLKLPSPNLSHLSIILTMVNQLSLSFVYIYLSFTISPQYSIVLLFAGAFTMTCFLRVLQKYHKIVQLQTKWEKVICLLLVSYIYCHLLFFSAELFNLLNSLALLPQIWRNMFGVSKRVASNNHLVLLFALNNMFPIYLHFSAGNIFRISPNQTIGVVIFCLVVGQVIMVKGQYFVKKYRGGLERVKCCWVRGEEGKTEGGENAVVCSICLCEAKEIEVVTTSCEHQFHEKCLLKWMKYKRICPMDRKRLSFDDIY